MNRDIFYGFVKAINEHEVEEIYSLMADDHRFIDAHGHEVIGKDKMKAGWKGYFEWFPDYSIEITEFFDKDDLLGAFGFASGTYKGLGSPAQENYWKIPAAWKAIIKNKRIAHGNLQILKFHLI